MSDEQKRQVKKMVQQFDKLHGIQFSVIGFADNTGGTDFNENLSVVRAKEVADYLVSLGVSESNIISSGKGSLDGDLAKHQKRRGEITIKIK